LWDKSVKKIINSTREGCLQPCPEGDRDKTHFNSLFINISYVIGYTPERVVQYDGGLEISRKWHS
jgi:hypothetical protein